MERRQPDVILIVMDCVRASDFPGGLDAVRPTPVFDWFQTKSAFFQRSVSASSWTVPSHASLLTGLYPDALGSFSSSIGQLPFAVPTLPEILQEAGFSTCLISANHNLRPEFGMTRGFDRALWGGLWNNSLKIGSRDERPFVSGDTDRTDFVRSRLIDRRSDGLWKVVAKLAEFFPRYPAILDGTSRVIQAIRCGGAPYDGRVAPWVETAFSNWTRDVPSDTPSFTLINFMDCHESYLPDPEDVRGLGEWWRQVRFRQDVASWAKGRWKPKPSELEALHSLYRHKIQVLDRRVGAIFDLAFKAGRWEDTMVVLTSDHGQAFGEGGRLFHGNSTEDAVVRVPLFVRWPRDRWAGSKSNSWTSSVDILPSILAESGVELPSHVSGLPLHVLINRPRGHPVFSMTEIVPLPWNASGVACPKFEIVAFEGMKRTALVTETSVRPVVTASPADKRLHSIAASLIASARVDVGNTAPRGAAPDDRLRSWGYS